MAMTHLIESGFRRLSLCRGKALLLNRGVTVLIGKMADPRKANQKTDPNSPKLETLGWADQAGRDGPVGRHQPAHDGGYVLRDDVYGGNRGCCLRSR